MSENEFEHYDKIIDTEIADKMKSSYIEYAMSVIVSRALLFMMLWLEWLKTFL